MKIIHVVGARPNFMKIAPIMRAIDRHNGLSGRPIHQLLIHTGQHYDERMSTLFFKDLDLPKPDINLEVGSASHAEQTAEIMKRFEKICLAEKPTHTLVVGDVNSTLACALVSAKLGITIIHVEAGLRSFNRSMPEEINRVLTDAIADYLFITEQSAENNLLNEGIPKEKIFFVGNVMIDTLIKHKEKAQQSKILDQLGFRAKDTVNGAPSIGRYAILTLHRPSNVDDERTLRGIIEAIVDISKKIPIVFPIHPRSRVRLNAMGFEKLLARSIEGADLNQGIVVIDPLGYLDFLCLMSHAALILTDSGGIQEEATVLRVPCITLRQETERPVTITHGTNALAGTQKQKIIDVALSVLEDSLTKRSVEHGRPVPFMWDGRAADRIVEILAKAVPEKLTR